MSTEPAALKIETTPEGVTVASFRGASILDALTIQQIGRELYDLVEGRGIKKLVLDFAEVRFLSSQALGVLLTLRKKADKASSQIALAGIRPELRRVFKITNLDRLFGFFEDRGKALASFGG